MLLFRIQKMTLALLSCPVTVDLLHLMPGWCCRSSFSPALHRLLFRESQLQSRFLLVPSFAKSHARKSHHSDSAGSPPQTRRFDRLVKIRSHELD